MMDWLVPHKTPGFLKWLGKNYVWTTPQVKPTIFLTFDDGPIPEVTPYVLEVLDKHAIKATFFVVGDNIRKHPSIYEQVAKEGHRLGNHTFNHLKGTELSPGTYLDNIDQCQRIMEQTVHGSGMKKLFRPPYGRITKEEGQLLIKQGYKIIMWDVLTHDYNQKLQSSRVLSRSLKALENGSIVVFHDSLKSYGHLQAILEEFILESKAKGYQFAAL